MRTPSKLKPVSFAGVMVLSSIQAACLDVPEDDPALASETLAATGSGSGSGSNSCDLPPTSPCSPHCGWSCAPNPAPAQGRYPAPKVSGWMNTTYTYTLRATKYDVTVGGTSTHAGIGITRFEAGAGEHRSCVDTNGDGAGDTTRVTPVTSGPTPEVFDTANFNHGRTVLAHNSAPNAKVVFTVGGKQPAAYKESMEACIAWAQLDGFCDQACGNDAYTVPDAAKNDNDDPHPGDPTPFSNRRNYGVSGVSDPARWSHLTDLTTWGAPHYRVPRYGHNSNNDADAQNMMMGQCNGFRGWLDGAYDTMVSPAHGCQPDWAAIRGQLRQRIKATCDTHCAGVRVSNYPNNPAGDTNMAKRHASLTGTDGTRDAITPASRQCMPAGNYFQGLWGYTVCGM